MDFMETRQGNAWKLGMVACQIIPRQRGQHPHSHGMNERIPRHQRLVGRRPGRVRSYIG